MSTNDYPNATSVQAFLDHYFPGVQESDLSPSDLKRVAQLLVAGERMLDLVESTVCRLRYSGWPSIPNTDKATE
ncbi:MAG: hypothetical protein HND43_10125 [Armatimonadetes bacterium]|nr:MAG: hypothetical protein EDM74_13040 [Armatimonadota bacterium]MBL1153075.1 hypothetical protein [Armatimonadota bacterium]NOG39733.1 hypothetical protein [Armatimonadota bacterium]